MTAAHPPLQQPRFLAGIGVSLAVHLLLVGLWELARPPTSSQDDMPLRTQFLRLLPAPAPERNAAARPSPPPRAPVAAPAQRQAGQPIPQASSQAEAPAATTPTAAGPVVTADNPPAPSAPASSSATMLERAKLAAGGIDRTLRKENPRRGIQAPIVTAQMRLERGIARAAEVAPNKWYQAPKVDEVLDPGGYGRRRHRVRTALGTYCVTYESNHAPDGIDSIRRGIQPKMTNCDADEEPATSQDWNHKGLN